MDEKQKAHITISDDGLSAYVIVEPHHTRSILSEELLLEQLRESGVTHGIIDSLEEPMKNALAAVKQQQVQQPVLVAQGDEPEAGSAERFVVAEALPFPTELRDTAKRLFREYGAPRARRTVTDTVEVRRRVEKKGVFGRIKEEYETVREERPREESAKVPLKIVAARYLSRGEKAGTVEAMRPGSPGTSVRGEPIPQSKPSEPWFYTGDFIRRDGRSLYAEASGFLRIGPNWVDIVPYESHEWTLSFSEDRADCFLSYTPGEDPRERPDADMIVEEAKREGYPPVALLSVRDIEAMIDEALSAGRPIVGQCISTPLDAFIDIEISEDRLKAYLHLIKGRGGGRPLNLKDVGQAIIKSGVKKIDREEIRKDLATFRRSAEVELRSYLLAEGTPATRGPDAAVDFSLRELPDSEREHIVSVLRSEPQRAGENPGLEEFPPETIETVAPVDEDQRILTIESGLPGKPGTDVFGTPIPGKIGPEPEIHLFGSVTRKGNFLVANIEGVVDRRRDEDRLYIRVRPHRDVAAKIRISEDRLSAYLTVIPHQGTGRQLSRKILQDALHEKGVVEGVREEALEAALEADVNGGSSTTVLIARGRPGSVDGRPTVQFLVGFPTEQQVRIRSDGSADYRNQDHLAAVNEGQAIAAVYRESAKGKSVAVDGSHLAPISETARILHAGTNVESRTDEDGGILLVATTSGRIDIREDTVHVLTAHVIEGDVDMKSGNVKFPSSVEISGSVRSGFAVVAGGAVTVGDTVEAALVSSDGPLSVSAGVKGAGKAVIRSKDQMKASFIERARVFVVGSLLLDSGALQCSIKCNGHIECSGERSRIVGGEVKARGGITVYDLGSKKGTTTKISFGQDYVVEHRIGELEKQLERDQAKLVDLDTRMTDLSGAALTKAQREKAKLLKRVEHSGVQLFTSREKFEEHHESEITVRGTIYPGVIVESHGRTETIHGEQRGVRLTFDSETGKIVINRL